MPSKNRSIDQTCKNFQKHILKSAEDSIENRTYSEEITKALHTTKGNQNPTTQHNNARKEKSRLEHRLQIRVLNQSFESGLCNLVL